jgi:preprotein translocase subunit SecE
MADRLKLAVAAVLVLAGIGGFYQLSSSAAVLRLASVLAGVLAGAAVAWFTAPGQQLFVFSREAITETKKVVWPTRKESFQTTAAVFAFIVVMAIFLWISDKTLEYMLYDLVLGWKKS